MSAKGFILFLFFIFTQVAQIQAQKILFFNKSGKVKRIKYYTGDFIKLKTSDGQKISGEIKLLRDSSFIIGKDTIYLSEVKYVQNTQRFYGFNILGNFATIAGLGYLPLTVFNRTINDDGPIVTESAIVVSGTFLGIAAICRLITNRKYRISTKRPLKIIDISI